MDSPTTPPLAGGGPIGPPPSGLAPDPAAVPGVAGIAGPPMPPRPSLRKQALGGMMWTGGSYAVRIVVQIGLLAILARLLTPADFGIVALVAVIVNFLALLRGSGISEALVAERSPTQVQLSSAYWYALGSTAVIASLVVVLAPVAGWLYDEPDVVPVFLLSAAGMVLSSLSAVHEGLMVRALRFRPLAVRDVLSQLVAGGVAVVLAWQGFGFYALAMQAVVAAGFKSLFLWLASRWHPSFTFSWADLRGLLSFGSHVTGYSVLEYLRRSLDQFLLGTFVGTSGLAFYTQASHILRLPATAFNQVASRVMVPALTRLAEPRLVRDAFLKSVRLACTVAFFPIALVFVAAREGVLLLYGDQWLRTALILQIFAVLMVLHLATVGSGWIFRALRRPDLQTRLMLVALPVVLAGFVVGLRWGAEGVALGSTVAAFLVFPFMRVPLRLVGMTLPGYVAALAPLLGAAVLSGAAMWGTRWLVLAAVPDATPALVLAVVALAGLPVYLATVRLADAPAWREALRLVRDLAFRKGRGAAPQRPG
jgi:O-antigen/teichoic acid export membrane protein